MMAILALPMTFFAHRALCRFVHVIGGVGLVDSSLLVVVVVGLVFVVLVLVSLL